MVKNLVIGLGNTGTNIVKAIARSNKLDDVTLYAIDSVASSIDLADINRIKTIPIISDEKGGSGRSRDRGKAMYKFHEENGAFDVMYNDAIEAKSPVLVVSSSAGGTGSGSIVPLCEALTKRGIHVIPIIIAPNMKDPDAYHLNTNDLLIEMDDCGITTYSIFRNSRGDADYTPINNDVVEMIEIIFGKRYDPTTLDSIDDADLDVILNTPGRFLAVSVSATDITNLKKELTRKVFSGYQPSWSENESNNYTFMTGYSLTSMFAKQDFKTVFEEVNMRIINVYDEYRNIAEMDNDGVSNATLIVAGLPRPEIKIVDNEYNITNNIGDGMKRSRRPSFIDKKKASVVQVEDKSTVTGDTSVINKFRWK